MRNYEGRNKTIRGIEVVLIRRNQGVLIIPKSTLEELQRKNFHIIIRTIKRSYGNYYEPWVTTKVKGTSRERTTLSRFILKPPKYTMIDHIDGNPLNNHPDNLRICTHSQNGANRHKSKGTKFRYKGVAIKGKNYHAVLYTNGLRYSVSPFATQKEAAKMYDKLASWVFKDFAKLNFPS